MEEMPRGRLHACSESDAQSKDEREGLRAGCGPSLLCTSDSPSRVQGWRVDLLWLFACAVLASIYCVTSATQLGATVDEPDYIQLGMTRWRTGRHNLFVNAGIMPLSAEVQTLPLYLVELVRHEPFDVTNDLTRYLPWARANNLVFFWMLLAYGCWLGRQLGGKWGGRLVVAFLACEPNLLAHASLATTDLSLAACLLALLAHYRDGRVNAWLKWRWRVGLPLLFAALTFLAKASAIAFAPLVLFAVELERLFRGDSFSPYAPVGRPVWRPLVHFLRAALLDGGQVLGGGFLLALLYFGFGSGNSFRGEWAQTYQPHGLIGHSLWQFNQLLHSNALGAVTFQMQHQEQGHGGSLLLGHWYQDGVWYYYPVALAIKLCLPLLLSCGLIALVNLRALANSVFAAALILLAFSLTCRVQLGLRLFLPIVPLLVVAVAAAIPAMVCRAREGYQRRLLLTWTAVAVCWTLGNAVTVWPHSLCFANELAGGPSHNHLNLGDSGHDWGQGLPELLAWQREHTDAPLYVWYFGRDPNLNSAPVTPINLTDVAVDQTEARLRGCYLAVSTTLLYGGPGQSPLGERLREMRPIGQTMTFRIYDFTRPTEGRQLDSTGGAAK